MGEEDTIVDDNVCTISHTLQDKHSKRSQIGGSMIVDDSRSYCDKWLSSWLHNSKKKENYINGVSDSVFIFYTVALEP